MYHHNPLESWVHSSDINLGNKGLYPVSHETNSIKFGLQLYNLNGKFTDTSWIIELQTRKTLSPIWASRSMSRKQLATGFEPFRHISSRFIFTAETNWDVDKARDLYTQRTSGQPLPLSSHSGRINDGSGVTLVQVNRSSQMFPNEAEPPSKTSSSDSEPLPKSNAPDSVDTDIIDAPPGTAALPGKLIFMVTHQILICRLEYLICNCDYLNCQCK